mgnify:CR=1 FL=1
MNTSLFFLFFDFVFTRSSTFFFSFFPGDNQFTTMSLIVATDGLWDVIDSVEVGRLLQSYHAKGQTEFAQLLAAEAARRGSRDDITVLFVEYKRT